MTRSILKSNKIGRFGLVLCSLIAVSTLSAQDADFSSPNWSTSTSSTPLSQLPPSTWESPNIPFSSTPVPAPSPNTAEETISAPQPAAPASNPAPPHESGPVTPPRIPPPAASSSSFLKTPSRRPGLASTTKPEYVLSDRYVVEVSQDPGQALDPNLVLDVRIVGNQQIGAKDILKVIKTRQGRPFHEAALEEDKRALMQKGWFIDVKPRVEKTLSGYVITFHFIERPILHYVKIAGNKAHTRKILLEEANIKPGDALDPIAVHQARERMEQFYRDSGYYRVHTEILSGDEIGDRGAVFLVSEGPKQRVLAVEFEGNTIASSSRLKTLVQSKPGWFFWINSEFTRKRLDEDVEALTTYYRKLGFFYAKVDRKFVETDGYTGLGQNRNWVKVKFVIDEGPRCRVRDIRFIGNKVRDGELLRKAMKLPKEKFFNQDMLEMDMNRIKEEYGKIGYVFAQAEPDPRIDDEFVDLVINVREGPCCYLESLHIEIVGNEGADPYTKLKPILNPLSLRPGDILSTKEINASKRRLRATQLFNTNPTQGQVPDIIFTYPEEAIEDEARQAEALEAGNPKIRGQAASTTKKRRSAAPTAKQPDHEAGWGRFSDFFRIGRPKQATDPAPARPVEPKTAPGGNVERTAPLRSKAKPGETAAPCGTSLGGQSNDYARADKPSWNGEPDRTVSYRVEKTVYRGQSPAGQSAALFSTPTVNTAASNPSAFAPVYIAPAQSNIPAGLNPISYSGYDSAGPSSIQGSGSLAQLAATTTTGYYGPTQYDPNRAVVQATPTAAPASLVRLGPGEYTPPMSITPPEYQPTAYLSPTSNQQYIGGAALYNQGTVFTQHTPQAAQTSVLLGSDPIDNSAYGINPYDPTSKIYGSRGTIVVQETRTGQLMMSVAVSSDSGLMGRFIIEEQNFDILNLPKGWRLRDWKNAFRGKGQRFRIEAVPGTDVQRYSVSWETPHLFDLDYQFGVNGFYYERYYDEWYEDRIGGGITLGKLWTQDFSTSLSLGAQNVKIYRPINPIPYDLWKALGDHPMYAVGLNASYNTRDSEYMPTEGHLISGGIEQVFGDYRFLRGNIDLRKYFTLHERPDQSGRWVLGLRSSLGVTEKGTPIYERYYGGGYTNLRGFEYRGVSPRQGGVVVGGCMEFYNSAELVFPITADDMIRGSVFVDSGTVEESISRWNSNYRVAVGFGLRLTIPMMGPAPIALDFAFPVSKQSGDDKQVFSFNIGFMR